MKKEALDVRCVYVDNAKTANQILQESFRIYLQRQLAELEKKRSSNV